MFKKRMKQLVLPILAVAVTAVSMPQVQSAQAQGQDRAYVMLMADRTFGPAPHAYVALGQDRKSDEWNLPGGKKDPGDPTRGAAAARELKEETAGVINKVGDKGFWTNRPSYEFGRHKVFLIAPGEINFQIGQIDAAVKKNAANSSLHYSLREMKAYEFIRVSDLVNLANQQARDGQTMVFNHSQRGNMTIDGWMLTTLKKSGAGNGALARYQY